MGHMFVYVDAKKIINIVFHFVGLVEVLENTAMDEMYEIFL